MALFELRFCQCVPTGSGKPPGPQNTPGNKFPTPYPRPRLEPPRLVRLWAPPPDFPYCDSPAALWGARNLHWSSSVGNRSAVQRAKIAR